MPGASPPIPKDVPPQAPLPTSLSLLDKLRVHQPEAWSRTNHLYRPLVFFWCNRGGVWKDNIEDICQEVFRVAFQKLPDFRRDRPGDTFRGWLRGITRIIILEHFRRSGERAEGGTDAGRRLQEMPDTASDDHDEPEELRAGLLHRALALIQAEFTSRDWEVFRLLVVEKQTATEVAKQMNLKSATARQVKCRILKRIKEELGDGEPVPDRLPE